MSEPSLPAVSVLISTKDRRELLNHALESLRQIDYPRDRFEIVVVEETDSPRDPGVDRYVSLPRENRGFAWSRNRALETASHPIVAFTDDDCIVDKLWLRQLVQPFGSSKVDAVAGGVLGQPSGILGRTEIVLGFPGGGLRRIAKANGAIEAVRGLSTVNAAAKKEILQQLGGFCEATGIYGGEDSDLFERLTRRHRAVFNPHALVYHRARDSVSGIYRWFYRRGIAALVLARLRRGKAVSVAVGELKSSFLLRLGLVVAGLVLLPIRWLPSLPLLALAYYVVMILRYRFALRRMGLGVLLLTPFTKVVMDIAFDLGRARGLALWWRGHLRPKHAPSHPDTA